MNFIPHFGKTSRPLILLAVAAITALLWTPYLQTLSPQYSYGDEGFVVQSAYRIVKGEVPYRDFFNAITPGSYYWTALWMKFFGTTFFAVRIGTLATSALIMFSSLLVLDRLGVRSRAAFLMVAAFLSFYGGPFWFIASHHWVALLFCLVSLLLLLPKDGQPEHPIWPALAGFTTALVVFTMQHLGAAWLLCASLTFVFRPAPTRLKSFLYFCAGGLLFALPTASMFISSAGLETLVNDLIHFPLSRYHAISAHQGIDIHYFVQIWQSSVDAWPKRIELLPLLRFFTIALQSASMVVIHLLPFAGIVILVKLWRQQSLPRYQVAVLCAFFAANYLTSLARLAAPSLVYAAPAAVLLLAIAYEKTAGENTLARIRQLMTAGWTVMFAAVFLTAFFFQATIPKLVTETPAGPVSSLASWDHDTLHGLNAFFRQQRPASDEVYIHPYAPMLYFLFGQDNPTKHDTLVYPMSTKDQFREVLETLEQKKTRWVVVTTRVEKDPFLVYLSSHYRPVQSYTYATIYQRIAEPRKSSVRLE